MRNRASLGSGTEPNNCDLGGDGDCKDARSAKCKAGKAFSIIGVLVVAVIVGLQFVSVGGKILKTFLAVAAAVCFIIVWSVIVGVKNDGFKNDASADCGFKTSNTEVKFLWGFWLQIAASVLCLIMIPLQLLPGHAETV